MNIDNKGFVCHIKWDPTSSWLLMTWIYEMTHVILKLTGLGLSLPQADMHRII